MNSEGIFKVTAEPRFEGNCDLDSLLGYLIHV
jgi:hypothetical protein